MHRALAASAAALALTGVGGGAYLIGTVRSPAPVAAATADASDATRGVVVSGLGTTTGVPDVLRLTLGVEVRRSDVTTALTDANTAQRAVSAALKRSGVTAADMQTSGLSIYPAWTNKGAPAGYTVTEQVTAKLRRLSAAGRAIADAVSAGGNAARLQGVAFELEDNAALLQRARDAAFADAKQKAETYARLAGRPLGGVQTVSEAVGRPEYSVPSALSAKAAGASVVPLSLGRSQVEVTVTVRWALG